MRIAFFTASRATALPVAPTTKQIDLEESMSEAESSSDFSEENSTSLDEISFDALAEYDGTPLPETDDLSLKRLLLSPLEPECDF